jgi:hypothetical protein
MIVGARMAEENNQQETKENQSILKRVFKGLLKTLGVLIALVIILIIVGINWDRGELFYAKLFWEPDAEELFGVNLGTTRSDLIFAFETECNSENTTCVFDGKEARFDDNDETYILTRDITLSIRMFSNPLPFQTVEEMKYVLGEENLYATSADFEGRRYTYLDWGITFGFRDNLLIRIMMGDVTWRSGNPSGEYKVNGRTVCPSEDCPWDDEGVFKPEYEDKSYRDFL